MPKKTSIRPGDITEKDIFSLYEGVLPLLYKNSEGLDPVNKLARLVKQFVKSNFICYLLDDLTPRDRENHYFTLISKMPEFADSKKGGSRVSIENSQMSKQDIHFDESIKSTYQTALKNRMKDFPDQSEYHYYQIVSRTNPKIFVGFFRAKENSDDNSFSKDDKDIYKILSPHIFLLLRTVLSISYKTQSFQYVDALTNICSGIANGYILSDAESKLLPEILFGYSNEEISKRNFVTVATVKKHIKHIFKKTHTKNRVDFISKFFTSPDRIDL
jgi:DNA-binding CsgD family transcriptional regulator